MLFMFPYPTARARFVSSIVVAVLILFCNIVFFTSYLMLGLQLAARYLEDPFGYDLSDLELDLVNIVNSKTFLSR